MSEDRDRNRLGDRLRAARTYSGFSQEEVAKCLGIPRPAVSLIESGERGVDALELAKLSRLFERPVDELATGKTPEFSETQNIAVLARTAARLSDEDREEVLRFAKFLQSRAKRRGDDSG